MDFSRVDRNRLTVAIALTALALPVLFIASGPTGKSDRSAEIATTTTLETGLTTDKDADAPANLDGPVSADPQGQGQLAYPADNSGRMVRGDATFKRFPEGAEKGCSTALVPLGAEITVRNLNNGRKTVCTNINSGPTSSTFQIVLHTGVFEKIAEIVDAPLPVELTW
ncbi:MAG: hypothetical protein ACKOQ1_07920 [Actinomycetota bacterium]